MSRYRIDEPIPASKAAHFYGPDGQVLGKIYRAEDTESLRFKRFIEAHDEIIDALRDAAKVGFDITAGDFDNSDVFNLLNQIDALIERIDGKEDNNE